LKVYPIWNEFFKDDTEIIGLIKKTKKYLLGHTNIETTQIYARITNSKIGSYMQGIDKKFIGIEKIYKEVAL